MTDQSYVFTHATVGFEREVLIVLIEECTEVAEQLAKLSHRASKALRFGLDDIDPSRFSTNREQLAVEMGDLLALIERHIQHGLVSREKIFSSKATKITKLKRYLREEYPETGIPYEGNALLDADDWLK